MLLFTFSQALIFVIISQIYYMQCENLGQDTITKYPRVITKGCFECI